MAEGRLIACTTVRARSMCPFLAKSASTFTSNTARWRQPSRGPSTCVSLTLYSSRKRAAKSAENSSPSFSRREELGDEYSADLAARFLEEYSVRDTQVDGPRDGWRQRAVFDVKVLADLAKNGHIERARTVVQAINLPSAMQNTLHDYEQYCKDRLYLRPSTLL